MKKKEPKHIGMDKFKLRLDLEMPEHLPEERSDVLYEDVMCETCGEVHRDGECDNRNNFRTGPIPSLTQKNVPVVPSTYIQKLREYAKKWRKKK